MLIKLLKYLKGYVKIKVEGYSPERLLNLCNVHHILLWGVEYKEAAYELYMSIEDYKKMRPLVRKTQTKLTLLEKCGLPFFLHRFRKRKLFFGGMLFCAVSIYSLSLFVWNIHIEGNVTQQTEELLDYMETLGVSHGVLKSKIVCEEIETKLRSKYPNILWVSAELRGTRILVQIKENEDEDIVSSIEEKEESAVRIVSEHAGIVESMIVRSGTPLVQAGDEVSVGQTLVEGYYEIKNDGGEVIRYESVPADADIFLKTEENYTDDFSAEYEKKNYTERRRMTLEVQTEEKAYGISVKIPFEKYEKVSKTVELRITENFYLPFSVKQTWYLEYVTEPQKYSSEEIKELSEVRFYEKYENILQKGVQIIEKDVKINTNGKLCHVNGTVTLLIPVTKKVPVELPVIENDASLEGEN